MSAPEDALRPGEGGATVSPIVGERSFMLSDGDEHRIVRKTFISAFHVRAVEQHAGMVADVAERTLAGLPTDTVVALHPELRSMTLEVILRTMTGSLTASLDDRLKLLHGHVLEMLSITSSPVFVEPRLRHGPGRRTWQNFLRRRAQVDQLLAELIEEHGETQQLAGGLLGALREHRETQQLAGGLLGALREHGETQQLAGGLLGALSARESLDGSSASRSRGRDNIMSLILAGHETTASQLAWAFQLLAHNPAARDRLLCEIDAGVSEEYLTATIQEVLRHRCVFVFAIPRVVASPVEIGDWTYHPPAQLLACTYLAHHDPSVYADPHTFRPERFLGRTPDPRMWIPWGGGRKRCPGRHMAILEMKTVLRTVLAERTVHPASRRMEGPRWRSVIVTPHAGSRVILRRRDRR